MKIPRLISELFSIDPRALALLRIALGILLLADLILRSPLLGEHYTALGVLPLVDLGHELPGEGSVRPLFPYFAFPHLLADSLAWQASVFVVHGIVSVLLLLGLFTRTATFLAWFLLVSLHTRNPTLIYGADDLLRMMLLWSIFLPLGRHWSLDARRSPVALDNNAAIQSPAAAALLLQVFCMYFFTWWCKSGDDWFRGDAVYYAMHMDVYASRASQIMRRFPDLLRPLSVLVFWFEIAGPLLLFSPIATYRVRRWILAGFLAMQIGFGLFLSLGLFPWVASAALLPFLRFSNFKAAKTGSAVRDDSARSRPGASIARILMKVFIVVLLVHVLLLNTRLATRVLPSALNDFLTFGLRLDQTWCMFAPYPGRRTEWDRIVVIDRAGKPHEIFPGRGVEGPALLEIYDRSGGRRRDYLTEIHEDKHKLLYARYLCRTHVNEGKGGTEFIELYEMGRDIPPPVYGGLFTGREAKLGAVQSKLFLRYRCRR